MTRLQGKYRFFLVLYVLAIVYSSCSRGESCESCVFQELTQEEKLEGQIALGRSFFFDKRFSRNNTISCSTCHVPKLAFTDGKSLSVGVEERVGFRNAPTLLNVADATAFMFDAEITSLEQQAIVPIQDHAEMDMRMGDLIELLEKDNHYVDEAFRLYGRPLDAFVITRSLGAFERSLVSKDSRFDQFYASKDTTILSVSELEGWKVFQRLNCISCHKLPHFTDYNAHRTLLGFDERDLGRFRVTGDSLDIGAFKTPTLRNIALTAPYKHDGSEPDLDRLIQRHRFGTESDAVLWSNLDSENSQNETELIVSFLHSLTDTSYLMNMP